jgi:hypothetical protein
MKGLWSTSSLLVEFGFRSQKLGRTTFSSFPPLLSVSFSFAWALRKMYVRQFRAELKDGIILLVLLLEDSTLDTLFQEGFQAVLFALEA